MKLLLTLILMLTIQVSFAQKQAIDPNAYGQWPTLGRPNISNNGKFVVYSISNVQLGNETAIIQSTNGQWKKEFTGSAIGSSFSADSKFLIFKTGKDSLVMLTLGTNILKYIPNISSYSLKEFNKGEWLCYNLVSKPKELILLDVKTNRKKSFENINSWRFSEDGNSLLIWRSTGFDSNMVSLSLINLNTNKESKIWKGDNEADFIFDNKHNQLVLSSGDSLWHYKLGSAGPVCLPYSSLFSTAKKITISGFNNFSNDGKRLFVTLTTVKMPKPMTMPGSAEVWSYLDARLQSEVDAWIPPIIVVLDLTTLKITHLQENSSDQVKFPSALQAVDTLALIKTSFRELEPWSIASKLRYKLISTKTGQKKDLNFLENNRDVYLTDYGKYLIYYDFKQNDYCSYEIATGRIRNLTKGLNCSWISLHRDDLYKAPRGFESFICSKNDEYIIIGDRYDIWKLDPLNKNRPINLTNGYGKKNQVVFNFAVQPDLAGSKSHLKNIYLSAFNLENKNNGFYSIRLDKIGNPAPLFTGPYIFNVNTGYDSYHSDFQPIKARNSNAYIVRRMSANEFPNYFSTEDFKSFTQLSNLNPEKKFNWYTTELHSWKSLDGKVLKGILYKPENFNPNKKYPIIFHYYERKSDGLNAYIPPEALCGSCHINIPSYVSQGYLVFTPDIYYTIGDPMQGTYDAVVSAANYASSLPFVNAKKMGLQGCSFGGIQTDYLIANTNLFAAACSVVGYADWISTYGALALDEGFSEQRVFETGQQRMGASIWEIPNQYFKNSSLLKAHMVTTPLLMMNNKLDGIIPYNDAISLFTGLRRLGKRAWLLSYRTGGHGVYGDDAIDFSARMMQFFNHYLKDKPAPVWMTRGISSSSKGIDNGYKMDTEIKTPGPGLLTPKEQQKVDSLMTRSPVTITLK